MANINLAQNSYVDYDASLYFKASKVDNLAFTPKVVKEKDGTQTILIHVSGTQLTSGVRVNVDLWPRRNATPEDIEKFTNLKSLSNIVFRIGYWPVVDENGEKKLAAGTPKWVSYFDGTTEKFLNGKDRVYGVPNSNDPREPEAADTPEPQDVETPATAEPVTEPVAVEPQDAQ